MEGIQQAIRESKGEERESLSPLSRLIEGCYNGSNPLSLVKGSTRLAHRKNRMSGSDCTVAVRNSTKTHIYTLSSLILLSSPLVHSFNVAAIFL